MNTTSPPLLVDEHAIAAMLGLSVATLQKDRRTVRRFPFVRIGKSIRYNVEAVRAACEALSQGGDATRRQQARKAA